LTCIKPATAGANALFTKDKPTQEISGAIMLRGQPYLDGIRINVVPDESGLAAALRTKAADMAIITDAKVAKTLRSESGVTLDSKPSLSYNLLFLNTKRPPFDNIKVRQAIAYAYRWINLIKVRSS